MAAMGHCCCKKRLYCCLLLLVWALCCRQTVVAVGSPGDGLIGLGMDGKTLYVDPPESGHVVVDGVNCKAEFEALTTTNTTLAVSASALADKVEGLKLRDDVLSGEMQQLRDSSSILCRMMYSRFQHDSVFELGGHSQNVRSLVVNGDRLFSGSGDNTVRVWDLTQSVPTTSHVLADHTAGVRGLAVDANGRFVFSGSSDDTIRVWDMSLSPPSTIHTLTPNRGSVWTLALHGTRLYAGFNDSSIAAWELSTLPALPPTNLFALTGHSDTVWAVVVHNGRLYSASSDKTIRVWDLSRAKLLFTLTGHTDVVWSLAAHGDRLYSGSQDGTIRVWDLPASKPPSNIHTLTEHSLAVRVLAVDNDGFLYSGSSDNTVGVWDLSLSLSQPQPPPLLSTLVGHTLDVRALTAANGLLYSGGGDVILLWDTPRC
eukprot:m.180177 g.180177  ORF g.180177 m.180177 type:complete len:428 (-) comp18010_c0_seq1:27-1310(-)